MVKNLVSGPTVAPLDKIWAQKFFHGFYLYCMLDIAASYHCMQFQGKLMNQTWENGKKLGFWTNFGPFGPKQIFLEFYLYYMLNIVSSYHCMQFQGKLMNQAWKNSKKPGFGSDFGPFSSPIFFFKNLAPSVSRYYGQLWSFTISEKTNDSILVGDGQKDRRTRVIS